MSDKDTEKELILAKEKLSKIELQRASECDVLNTELRENYRRSEQVDTNDDWRHAIRELVDGARYSQEYVMKCVISARRYFCSHCGTFVKTSENQNDIVCNDCHSVIATFKSE